MAGSARQDCDMSVAVQAYSLVVMQHAVRNTALELQC